MGGKSVPMPVVAAIIAVLAIMVIVFLYKGATGGTVGDGKEGNVQASPPISDTAKQQMMQSRGH